MLATRPGGSVRSRLAAVLLTLVACLATPASAHHRGVERVRFLHYGIDDGLSQSTVRALAQDRTGFLWFGTQDGLNRFDGYEFRAYRTDPSRPGTLGDDHVTVLLPDADGRLWVGTQSGGLHRYLPLEDRFERWTWQAGQSDGLAGNPVQALAQDADGRLWVASAGGALQWFDGSRFRDVPAAGAVALGSIRRLVPRADGGVWVGSRRGLWLLGRSGEVIRELRGPGGGAIGVLDVVETPTGGLWVATGDAGLLYYGREDEPQRQWRREDGLPDDMARSLLLDRQQRLWIGTYEGLARLDHPDGRLLSWRHDPAAREGLASNSVQTLLEDRDGLVWIGTWLNGVNVFNPRTEAFVDVHPEPGDPSSLPTAPANAIAVGRDGTFWIGLLEGGGLVNFDLRRGVIARWSAADLAGEAGGADQVAHLAVGRDGAVWVATGGSGLARIATDGRWERWRHDPADPASLPSDNLERVYEDGRGRLWVSTLDAGLAMRCAGCSGFRRYREDPEDPTRLGADAVGPVLEDSRGTVWVGLRAGGLDRLDPDTGRAVHFRADPDEPGALSSDAITVLHENRNGDLWIGTRGGGLVRMLRGEDDRVAFQAFTRRDGLAADAIGGIVEDAQGRLWVSTTSGISRLDPDTEHIDNYTQRDGVHGAGYFIGAYAHAPSGDIVFGGPRGVTLFDPAGVESEAPTLAVALTDVIALGRDARLGGGAPILARDAAGLRLAPGVNDIRLEFSALTYADPAALRYDYRLEGVDDRWIDADARRRFATYTNLAPGRYRFEVRAAYAGAPPGPPTTVDITLAAPWWRTPAAYVAYALAALGLAAVFAWQMASRLRERAAADAALRASEERLKLALWGSGDELWDADLATDALVRVNPIPDLAINREARAQTLTEYVPAVHADDMAGFKQALAAHLRGDAEWFEAVYRTRDVAGHWRWLRSRGRVVERAADGRARRIVGTASDMTELKAHEQALERVNAELEGRVAERTRDLSEANANLQRSLDELRIAQGQLVESEKLAALGSLVAGVAHEINTPLGIGVTAASHLAQESRRVGRLLETGDLKRSDLEAYQALARESTELILRNLQRADKLVKSFKQVAVDQSSEQKRTLELRGYLDEILTSLHPALKKTRHRVEVDCAAELVLETYPGAIYQIVVNLVMNSLLHGFEDRESGTIRIVARREAEEVALDYADDGKGMSEEVRRRVFEPFFTTKRGHGGSGLGMHIVYNLATQVLGGRIALDSAPGRGVRIAIRFPVRA